MDIVRAGKEDLPEILALQKLAYQSEAAINGPDIQPLRQTLSEVEAEFDKQTFLKASRGGEIIGSVRAYVKDGTCFVGKLIVHPDYRGIGLGSRLLSAAEVLFPETVRSELYTSEKSESNLRFYAKCGYKPFKTGHIDGLNFVFLEKPRVAPLDLGIDFASVGDVGDVWARIPRVEIEMVEQHEKCKHCLGDKFVYETPYVRPAGVCTALLHVIDLYVWRVALGFPSWYPEDRGTHFIHCPDRKGTVWAVRRLEK